MSGHTELKPDDLDFQFIRRAASSVDSNSTLEEVERLHIRSVLQKCKGEISATAKILGISRTTLYSKIKTYGLEFSEKGNQPDANQTH